jgi:hypothetical protein
MRALIIMVGVLLTWPGALFAQPTTTENLPPRACWDVTGLAAFLAGSPDLERTEGYHDNWYETGQVGVIVGRHLSRHLKLEFEASTSAEARQYVQRFVTLNLPPPISSPGYPQQFPIATERYAKLHQVSGLVTWQFFDNEWVHPFLQVGAGADIERVRWQSFPNVIYVNDPRVPGRSIAVTANTPASESKTMARLLVGGGAKLYVTPRAFFRADARFGGGVDGEHFVLRLGFGADF